MKSMLTGFLVAIFCTATITMVAVCCYSFFFLVPMCTGYASVGMMLVILIFLAFAIFSMWSIGEVFCDYKKENEYGSEGIEDKTPGNDSDGTDGSSCC